MSKLEKLYFLVPACQYLAAGVELNTVAAINMQVAVEGVLPTREWEE